MSNEATTVTDKLRDKIKSKMDVAKFFTGFITLLIGFLLKGEELTSPSLKIGIVFLIASLGFCVAAMFTYDHLLWPKEHFESSKDEIPETNFRNYLETNMVKLWKWLFVPAVGGFGVGFLFLLMQQLGLSNLRDFDKGIWVAALVIAFVLPILVCCLMWPRIDKSKKEPVPIHSD